MPQIVAAQVAVAELGHYLIPVGGIAQDRGGDPAAARAGEQAGPATEITSVEVLTNSLQ